MTGNKPGGTAKDSHYARLRRAHNEQRDGGARQPRQGSADAPPPTKGFVRLYGLHTVRAALANPRRKVRNMQVTRNALQRLEIGDPQDMPFPVEIVEPKAIDRLLGPDAVHQGVVIETKPLPAKPLSALGPGALVLVLDQVTDPHNVGAIMRSAVAFDVVALVTTSRHSPSESGVLAKSASGALEHIDHLEVRNLAEALGELHEAGFRTVGLDSEGPGVLEASLEGPRIALVLGAEGKGLRQKTRETVSVLARLDLPGAIHSLNVSNAAAVALYATRGYLTRTAARGGAA